MERSGVRKEAENGGNGFVVRKQKFNFFQQFVQVSGRIEIIRRSVRLEQDGGLAHGGGRDGSDEQMTASERASEFEIIMIICEILFMASFASAAEDGEIAAAGQSGVIHGGGGGDQMRFRMCAAAAEAFKSGVGEAGKSGERFLKLRDGAGEREFLFAECERVSAQLCGSGKMKLPVFHCSTTSSSTAAFSPPNPALSERTAPPLKSRT